MVEMPPWPWPLFREHRKRNAALRNWDRARKQRRRRHWLNRYLYWYDRCTCAEEHWLGRA